MKLKYIIYLLIFQLSLISCVPLRKKSFISSKFELRQLVKETENKKESSGVFFLIGGSFHSEELNETKVKCFAKVDGSFRIIEMPIEDIRIRIDNKLKKPNIQVKYEDYNKLEDEKLLNEFFTYKVYVINCPETYLPEKLLPIEL